VYFLESRNEADGVAVDGRTEHVARHHPRSGDAECSYFDAMFAIVVGLVVALVLAAVFALVVDDRTEPGALPDDSEPFAARR
jgi:hypothetical protein